MKMQAPRIRKECGTCRMCLFLSVLSEFFPAQILTSSKYARCPVCLSATMVSSTVVVVGNGHLLPHDRDVIARLAARENTDVVRAEAFRLRHDRGGLLTLLLMRLLADVRCLLFLSPLLACCFADHGEDLFAVT